MRSARISEAAGTPAPPDRHDHDRQDHDGNGHDDEAVRLQRADALLTACHEVARAGGTTVTKVVEAATHIEASDGHQEKCFSFRALPEVRSRLQWRPPLWKSVRAHAIFLHGRASGSCIAWGV